MTLDDHIDIIWMTAHELAKAGAFPDWPLIPVQREDLYELLRDTAAAFMNVQLFEEDHP